MKSCNATLVAIVVAIVLVAQASALTTFGTNRSPDNKTSPAQPPPVRGKECKADSECSIVPNTICTTDSRDHKMRCLCVSKSAPANGACPRYPRALKSQCKADEECIMNAHCSTNNSTTNANTRTCMCREGFEEDDHMCNYGFSLAVPSVVFLFTISFLSRGF